jgi:hypothetical protein
MRWVLMKLTHIDTGGQRVAACTATWLLIASGLLHHHPPDIFAVISNTPSEFDRRM